MQVKMATTKKPEQRTWRFLLLEVLIPEKESEKFEGSFRTVPSLTIICLAEGEKMWTYNIQWATTILSQHLSKAGFRSTPPQNPLTLVMGLYKGGLASYSFKWNLKFRMPWKSHWDFHVVLPPDTELSQGMEKQLAWFVTITPGGYGLEGTDSDLVAGRSMVFLDERLRNLWRRESNLNISQMLNLAYKSKHRALNPDLFH